MSSVFFVHTMKENTGGSHNEDVDKILLFPVMTVLKIASVIIELLAKISAILAGPFLVFVTGCGIYCVVTTNWTSLIILAVIAGTVVLVYVLIGIVLGLLDIAGSRIKWFIRS